MSRLSTALPFTTASATTSVPVFQFNYAIVYPNCRFYAGPNSQPTDLHQDAYTFTESGAYQTIGANPESMSDCKVERIF